MKRTSIGVSVGLLKKVKSIRKRFGITAADVVEASVVLFETADVHKRASVISELHADRFKARASK
jgi:hypothetical protein